MSATRSPEAMILAEMTEEQWQQQVIEAANLAGFRVHHQLVPVRKLADGSRIAFAEAGTHKGFPDLVLAGKGRVIFAECKTEVGRLTDDQRAWINQLQLAGQEAYVWRPSDWPSVRCFLGLE